MSSQKIIIFKVLKTFPYIKYTLVLCRKTEFYTFHYIMPTLVISVLALASFVVHPESGDKVYFLFGKAFCALFILSSEYS